MTNDDFIRLDLPGLLELGDRCGVGEAMRIVFDPLATSAELDAAKAVFEQRLGGVDEHRWSEYIVGIAHGEASGWMGAVGFRDPRWGVPSDEQVRRALRQVEFPLQPDRYGLAMVAPNCRVYTEAAGREEER